jgi:hypothetical protein
MRVTNLVEQPFVLDRSATLRPPPPRVKAARAHPVQLAHHPDRVRLPLGFDELEDLALRAEVNAMAFFKSSCSSFSRS